MSDKVFTVQTLDGPALVQATPVGVLAVHPNVGKAGPNLGWWTVSLPCGVAMGHYPSRDMATQASEFLLELGIDWTLPLEELYRICKAKGIYTSLTVIFGARTGSNPVPMNRN